MIKFGINGFGRMGRLVYRVLADDPALRCTRINEIACDAAASAHLMQFDSVHGQWPHECHGDGQDIMLAGHRVTYSMERQVDASAWQDCDIVIEATGLHHKQPDSLERYFAAGVRKVVCAAPTKDALNLVYGVNHGRYEPTRYHLLSAASCTTNCLAPVVQVVHREFGIVHGIITTIHDLTNTQTLVDKGHKDWRRARAAGQSLIPTTTGSARAITEIFPELKGKLNGHAVRVPLANASLTDCVFETARAVTVDEVNAAFAAAASSGPLVGILGFETRPLVSVDYVNDPRSCIVDGPSTMVVDGTQLKIYAWYDNEWGYVNRLADVIRMVAQEL